MMNSTSKTDTKIVPWFNRSEWELVFDMIYSDDSTTDKRSKALEILNMWKARNPLLPSGIEGTIIILQALKKDESKLNLYDLQSLYSTAVLRFLNVCAAHNTKQGTFSSTAAKQNIPRWMINMRHDIAHDSNLPSLDTLKKALDYSFKWLYDEYWHPVSLTIQDYVTEADFEDLEMEAPKNGPKYSKIYSNLEFLIHAIECLTVFQHAKFKLKYIDDIPDETLKSNFLTDLRWFGASFANITGGSYIWILNKTILEYLFEYLRTAKMGIKKIVIHLLLDSDTFICDPALQMQMFGKDDIDGDLPWKFVKLWQEFLNLLHRLSLTEHLLYKLFEIVNNVDENPYRRKIAALWIKEIGKGYKKLNDFQSSIPHRLKLTEEITDSIDRKSLNITWTNEFAVANPELKKMLTFDLFFPIPNVLQDIKLLNKVAFNDPNVYTAIFIISILDTVHPPLDSEASKKLCDIVDKYTNPKIAEESDNTQLMTIYTVEDLCANGSVSSRTHTAPSTSTTEYNEPNNHGNRNFIYENDNSDSQNSDEDDDDSDNKWELAPAHISFNNVPIGLLPWQDDKLNPALSAFIT